MADYWKSQPRKFCQYCKCWIADNKPSVEFHEKGKNHKENVAAKISEIKKKSVQKAKQEQRMSKQFAAMEEAAVKAYEEDLKRMQREEAFGPEAETSSTTSTYKPEPLVQPPKQPQVKTQQPKHKKAGKKNTQPRPPRPQHTEAVVWVEGKTDEGYTYYYNTVTGESRWEKPEEGEGSQSAQHGKNESSTDCAWMEVVSPEGYTYYYNTKTRESSWEKPSDSLSSETPESSQQEQRQEDPSKTAGDPQVTEGEEESKNDQPSMETEVTEQVNQQSTVPQINSRKRKAEADPSEETSKDLDETHKDSSEENRQEKCNVPENNNEEEKQVETQIRKPKAPNPYGSWEKIKEEKDPYANVDWQLPQVEGEATTTADLPLEPKHKFKTRVITSLGDNTGPVTFKKTKTQNGKSRNLRQRDGDD